MKHKTTQALYAYWNAVRGQNMAPRRFDIEPARISDILSETFILERGEGDDLRYRLAGTRICDLFGAELRGRDFLCDWAFEDQLTLRDRLRNVMQFGRVASFTFEAKAASGSVVTFETLILPLLHTRDVVDRLLGSMVPLQTPTWLGHEPLVTKRLLDGELIWPEGRPHAFAEQLHRQTPFHPHIRHARIVRSNRRQFRVYDGGLDKPTNG